MEGEQSGTCHLIYFLLYPSLPLRIRSCLGCHRHHRYPRVKFPRLEKSLQNKWAEHDRNDYSSRGKCDEALHRPWLGGWITRHVHRKSCYKGNELAKATRGERYTLSTARILISCFMIDCEDGNSALCVGGGNGALVLGLYQFVNYSTMSPPFRTFSRFHSQSDSVLPPNSRSVKEFSSLVMHATHTPQKQVRLDDYISRDDRVLTCTV